VALQPNTPMHGLEGWKHLETAIVPAIYDAHLADEIREVDTHDAYALIKTCAAKEDMLLSPSAAANLAGALKVAEQIEEGTIVTILPDNADKYGEVINKLF
jgi:S-sulfo-L-cysteine synthase (O-acetyl-L-serine-dependent)